jgi:hypothetical protein
VLLATATLVFTASATPQDDVQSSVTQWEHLAISHQGAGLSRELSQQINRLGNEGWQLVCVSMVDKEGTAERTIYYFKRPK